MRKEHVEQACPSEVTLWWKRISPAQSSSESGSDHHWCTQPSSKPGWSSFPHRSKTGIIYHSADHTLDGRTLRNLLTPQQVRKRFKALEHTEAATE